MIAEMKKIQREKRRNSKYPKVNFQFEDGNVVSVEAVKGSNLLETAEMQMWRLTHHVLEMAHAENVA